MSDLKNTFIPERCFLLSFIQLCRSYGLTFVNTDSYEGFLIAPLTSDRIKCFEDGLEDIYLLLDCKGYYGI